MFVTSSWTVNKKYLSFQSDIDKSLGHKVVHHSLETKKEVVALAQATSNREAAKQYNIDESTIRAWVKKFDATNESGFGWTEAQGVDAPKKAYFQQKYSEEVIKYK